MSAAGSHRHIPVAALVALTTALLLVPGAGPAVADEAPPRTTHSLDPGAPDGGAHWYLAPVEVRLTADDGEGGSGVAALDYRIDDGGWQTVEAASVSLLVAGAGVHTVEYRATDTAGNVEEIRRTRLRIDGTAPVATASVTRTSADEATVTVTADDTSLGSGVARTEYRVDGGVWQRAEGPEVALFDGTQASFDRWRHVGSGSFELTGTGVLETVGGMGMLWYPASAYGDATFTFEWREGRDDGQHSNAGAFVRFPDPEEATAYPPEQRHACQVGLGLFLAEWVAVNCGHEIQVNDGDDDPQQTGSIYNFKPLDAEQARPNEFGEWNTFEVRTIGDGSYTVTVLRNGEIINTFVNEPGQTADRPFDPPTDLRQFARGHVGLQNHGAVDTIQYRDIRVLPHTPSTTSFSVSGPGEHSIEFRAVDVAGNVGATQTIHVTAD